MNGESSARNGRPRVLIVYGNPDILDVLAETLARAHVEVVRAGGEREALGHLEAGSFHLLIADLDMEGLGGVDLIENAKRLSPQMPVFVVAGTQRARVLGSFRDLGIHAWFPKPFDPLVILDRVENQLSGCRGPP